MKLVPVDTKTTIADLVRDPYPIYQRLRATNPVIKVASVGRILLTKAEDTKRVKDHPEIFSSDDPNTPMKRAFLAHTLMRKDGADHMRERMAMAPAYSAKNIAQHWMPVYEKIADEFIAALPRGETVDLFPALAGPFAARCLGQLLGLRDVSDDDMQRWSQTLIDGAGNFGWAPALFEDSDRANADMDAYMDEVIPRHIADPNPSALCAMITADDPIELSQIRANIKIAIGGGLNEPRDALLTILYGLLTNPEQRDHVVRAGAWGDAFDEGVRWVAPIQVSSRLVTQDTEIRGIALPKGETVMTVQASANHDEEIWPDGHLFDATRTKRPHQAFGNGPHFCQGKHIARRMLSDILLPRLFDRFPDIALCDPTLVRFSGFGFRGALNFPVTLT
ncbi:cytochrome P450 [Sulfitobacter sp.]|uniref:cytochrome P450 n=1 Tax=Sulfitobacter sp. TaxID=1903071 RepID=UPI003EF76608